LKQDLELLISTHQMSEEREGERIKESEGKIEREGG